MFRKKKNGLNVGIKVEARSDDLVAEIEVDIDGSETVHLKRTEPFGDSLWYHGSATKIIDVLLEAERRKHRTIKSLFKTGEES